MSKSGSILLVEDDRWLADSFKRTLANAGHQVLLAENTLEAIELADSEGPLAIVLDVFLPGPNGIVLLHELQSHSDLASIPVVLCTNSAADIAPGALRRYGVKMILDKTTMHPGDLVAAVEKVLA